MRRVLVATAGGLMVLLGPGWLIGSPARAGTVGPSNNFTVTAEGDGLNIEVDYPGELPVVNSVSASPWGASAAIDSLGSSTAAAGAPYSPFVYSLPGTVNGLGAGELPSLPTAPGEVSTNYPTSPTASESTGPYALAADSNPDESKASVDVGNVATGGPSAPIFATADTVLSPDGTVTASASAGVDVLDIGGVLDLGNVSSSATLTEPASGKPQYSGSTHLGTLTVSGTTLGLTGTDLQLGPTSVEEPLTSALVPVLNAALASSGVTLAYVPETFEYADGTSSTGSTPDPQKTLEGVDSGGLSVTVTHSVPGQGTPTVIFTLGRVYVTTQNSAIPQGPVVGSQGTTSVGGGGASGSASSGSTLSASSPALGSSGASPAGSSTASGPSLSGIQSPSTPTSVGSVASGKGSAPSSSTGVPSAGLSGNVISHSAELFYLILVVGAVAALGGSQILRFLGVRLAFGARRRRIDL